MRGPTLWKTTMQHPSLSSTRGLTSQIFPICFHKYCSNQGATSFQTMLWGVIASQNAPPLLLTFNLPGAELVPVVQLLQSMWKVRLWKVYDCDNQVSFSKIRSQQQAWIYSRSADKYEI